MKLRAEHLKKTYRNRTVVNDVSLEVNQGEIIGLLGPNGAGKTTSFYMIVGLVQANGGTVYLDDTDITHFPMYKRAQNGVGSLAQENSVFRKLTVEQNIPSHGDSPLYSYRPEIRLAGRAFRRGGPHRGGGYSVYRLEVERQEYRYLDHRPQRAGNVGYHNPDVLDVPRLYPQVGYARRVGGRCDGAQSVLGAEF